MLVVSYLSFLPLFFGVQHLFNVIYASLLRRQIDAYSFLGLLDFVIFAVFITNIFITYAKNLWGTWMDYPLLQSETRAMIYARNYTDTPLVSENALWVICIVIMWVRVFYFLRYNEFMGKFIGIVERLFYEVLMFFFFYIGQLVFWALAAELCFRTLPDYNTAPMAFKTLFYASLGEFSFEEIGKSEKGEYFGITFMIMFLVCNVGIIINIFIAVIAVLYDAYSERRNVFQMLETLKIRSVTQADKNYSALISLPAPLNASLILLAPFLLTSSNPRKVNEFILSLAYIPVMFGVTLVFIVYNLLLVPLCFVKLWWHKLIMVYVYSKSYRVSRADKFMTFCVFWAVGLFTLTLNSLVDIYYFIRHLWLADLVKTQHKSTSSRREQISKDNIQGVAAYFRACQEQVRPYRDIAVEVRDRLGVFQYILKLLQPVNLFNFVTQKKD